MQTRKELTEAVRKRYRSASRAQKGHILDEFVKTTGYHRKHAVRLMAMSRKEKPRSEPARIYGEAVREAIILVWEAGDRMCGKRLHAALPSLVQSLEQHGHLCLDPAVRAKLLGVSSATIDRLLTPVRARTGTKRRRRKRPNAIQRQVAVRTHEGANKLPPGYFEGDFVVHNGGVTPGSCVHSLVLTDVYSGWTECMALVAREQTLVVESLQWVRPQLPVLLLGVDTDNDSAFMNESLFDYCKNENIELTRSRPYKKNDQAWVEQKNGSIVRHFAGYARFEGLEAAQALSRLYQNVRLYVNYFQPSFKLKEKRREGARVKKFYYPPATPCDRLLSCDLVHEERKDRLRQRRAHLDPVQLLHNIREAQAVLAALPGPPQSKNLEQFLKELPRLWENGEARAPHQKEKRPPRTYRTRKDPFESTWPKVVAWLEEKPDTAAKDLFLRLQDEHPGQYVPGQLRTLQRRVQQWRRSKATELVRASCAVTHLSSSRIDGGEAVPA